MYTVIDSAFGYASAKVIFFFFIYAPNDMNFSISLDISLKCQFFSKIKKTFLKNPLRVLQFKEINHLSFIDTIHSNHFTSNPSHF